MLVELLTAITTTIAIRISEHEIEEVAGLSFISGKLELQERSSLVEDNKFSFLRIWSNFTSTNFCKTEACAAQHAAGTLEASRAATGLRKSLMSRGRLGAKDVAVSCAFFSEKTQRQKDSGSTKRKESKDHEFSMVPFSRATSICENAMDLAWLRSYKWISTERKDCNFANALVKDFILAS